MFTALGPLESDGTAEGAGGTMASSASRIASGVAGARNGGALLTSGAAAATASRIARNTENGSNNGGSPTAFERNTVGSAFSLR